MYSNAEYYDMVLCVGRAPNNSLVAARELYSEQHPGRPVPSYGCFLRLVNRLHSTDDFLDQRFEEWIGRAGTVPWPPRSPDLTPLDFFLWGYLKGIVYGTESSSAEAMKKIIMACAELTPEIIRNATRSVIRRAEMCVLRGGSHIEPLL